MAVLQSRECSELCPALLLLKGFPLTTTFDDSLSSDKKGKCKILVQRYLTTANTVRLRLGYQHGAASTAKLDKIEEKWSDWLILVCALPVKARAERRNLCNAIVLNLVEANSPLVLLTLKHNGQPVYLSHSAFQCATHQLAIKTASDFSALF